PHLGREFLLRGHSPNQDVHELPFSNLGGQRDAGAGARELSERPVAALAARLQPARLRLLRPQYSHSQGRRLHHLSQTDRRDAADLPEAVAADGMVPRLSSQSAAQSPRAARHLQRQMAPATRSGASWPQTRREVRDQGHALPYLLHGMPSMNPRKNLSPEVADLWDRLDGAKGQKYWRTLEELANTETFQEVMRREFPEQAATWPSPLSRRQFLTLM